MSDESLAKSLQGNTTLEDKPLKRFLVIEPHSDHNPTGETLIIHDDGLKGFYHPTDGEVPEEWAHLLQEFLEICGDEDEDGDGAEDEEEEEDDDEKGE